MSAAYYWNTKTYPNGVNVSIPAWRNFHLYEIADDEANGNIIITKENVNTTKSVLAISLTINGGTNGLSDRTKQHTRIKSQNIFKDF